MRIGYIGDADRLDRIREIVDVSFSGNTIESVMPFTLIDKKKIPEIYKAGAESFDVILFSSSFTYSLNQLYSRTLVPTDYVHTEISSLLAALLNAVNSGYDIKRISVDGYSETQLRAAFKDCGLPYTSNVFIAEEDISNDNYFRTIADLHRDNYYQHNVSCCLTSLAAIYRNLKAQNIPAVLVQPSTEAITSALIRLSVSYTQSNTETQELLVIGVKIEEPSSMSYKSDAPYLLVLENMKIKEQVYRFAQKAQAVVSENSQNCFYLYSDKYNLNSSTNKLQSNPLMEAIHNETGRDVWMGIGMGATVMDARRNAQISLEKSEAYGRNSLFITSDHNKVSGPMLYLNNDTHRSNKIEDAEFLTTAGESGLSVQTIFKLWSIMTDKKTDTFTVEELAEYYQASVRTIYRILDKLIISGHAMSVGQDPRQDLGRPRKIYRLKL